jgi:hypothetical protein
MSPCSVAGGADVELFLQRDAFVAQDEFRIG